MAEIPDISTLSSDEVNALLEKHDRPVLCMVPKERIDFFQSREDTNQSLVTEYQEFLTAGDKLPRPRAFS